VIAQEIAPHIFSTMIRAEGVGRWHRDGDGQWIRDRFTIHSFRKLRDLPLSEAVERLRGIASRLHDVEDPLHEIHKLRHGNGSL